MRPAQLPDLADAVALFDAYRSFYDQPSDPRGAEAFLRERIAQRDSVLLVSSDSASRLVGFVQLYPSFSSVAMRRIFILNDLFVSPGARRGGVARSLLAAAREHALSAGAVRLSLATAVANVPAQRLYESCGYRRDTTFDHYHLRLEAAA